MSLGLNPTAVNGQIRKSGFDRICWGNFQSLQEWLPGKKLTEPGAAKDQAQQVARNSRWHHVIPCNTSETGWHIHAWKGIRLKILLWTLHCTKYELPRHLENDTKDAEIKEVCAKPGRLCAPSLVTLALQVCRGEGFVEFLHGAAAGDGFPSWRSSAVFFCLGHGACWFNGRAEAWQREEKT